ncbi:hypothetical protein pb186bvf_001485 [Paramecium bursaria]
MFLDIVFNFCCSKRQKDQQDTVSQKSQQSREEQFLEKRREILDTGAIVVPVKKAPSSKGSPTDNYLVLNGEQQFKKASFEEEEIPIELSKTTYNAPEQKMKRSQSQEFGVKKKIAKNQDDSKRKVKIWDKDEDALLRKFHDLYEGNWHNIAPHIPGRNISQCSQRWRRINPIQIKQKWTFEEDQRVIDLVEKRGRNWTQLAKEFPGRSGKQIRERFLNKLDPQLIHRQWAQEEDTIVLETYKEIGPKWSIIAQKLKGRSENMVKNRFYSHIQKAALGKEKPYQVIRNMEIEYDSSELKQPYSENNSDQVLLHSIVMIMKTDTKKIIISKINLWRKLSSNELLMIQLKPQLTLRIDKLGTDGICFRIFLAILFYVMILIWSFKQNTKYLADNINMQNWDNQTLTGCYIVIDQSIKELEIEVEFSYDQQKSHLFKKYSYNYTIYQGYTERDITNESKINASTVCLNLNLTKNFSRETEFNHEGEKKLNISDNIHRVELEDKENAIAIQIHPNQNFFEMKHPRIKILRINKLYFNSLYYFDVTKLYFKIFFTIQIAITIWYFYDRTKPYPKQNWLRIHKWIQFLLQLAFFYNLPYQGWENFKFTNYLADILQMFLYSALSYFWLDIFELQYLEENDLDEVPVISKWNLFKLLLVFTYTIPQSLMDSYIFYSEESIKNFDPNTDIPYYKYYKMCQSFSLQALGLVYLILFFQNQRRRQTHIRETQLDQRSEIQKHDPFVEGHEIREQKVPQVRYYITLQAISLIVLVVLIFSYAKFQPQLFQETILGNNSLTALINIYLTVITYFYSPYQSNDILDDKQQDVYGEQDTQVPEFRNKKRGMWRNIQKELKQSSDDFNEEL